MARLRAVRIVLVYIFFIEPDICTAAKFIFPEATQDLLEPGVSMAAWPSSESSQIPYQLTLRVVDRTGSVNSCAGSVIHAQYGLTAAHCIADRHTIMVKAGCSNKTRSALIFDTQKYHVHPMFDLENRHVVQPHDIGIIDFGRKITFNSLVQPIRIQRLADMNKNYDGQRMIASGWSVVYSDVHVEQMNWVYLRGISNTECSEVFGDDPNLRESTLCARWYNYTSETNCVGNSGGPLTTYDHDGLLTQVGIATFVYQVGCHTGLPVGFLRPGFYHDWLTAVTGHDFNWNFEETSEKPTTVEFVSPFVKAREKITKTTTPRSSEPNVEVVKLIKPKHSRKFLPNAVTKSSKKREEIIPVAPITKRIKKKHRSKTGTVRPTLASPILSMTSLPSIADLDMKVEEYIAKILREELVHATSTDQPSTQSGDELNELNSKADANSKGKEKIHLIGRKNVDERNLTSNEIEVKPLIQENKVQKEKIEPEKEVDDSKQLQEDSDQKLLDSILEKHKFVTTIRQSTRETNVEKLLENVVHTQELPSTNTTKQFKEDIQKLSLNGKLQTASTTTNESEEPNEKKIRKNSKISFFSQLNPEESKKRKEESKQGVKSKQKHPADFVQLENLFQFAPIRNASMEQDKGEFLENIELEKLVPDYVISKKSSHLETGKESIDRITMDHTDLENREPENLAKTKFDFQKLESEMLKFAMARKKNYGKIVTEFMESIKIIPNDKTNDMKSANVAEDVTPKEDSPSSSSYVSSGVSVVKSNTEVFGNLTTGRVKSNSFKSKDLLNNDDNLLEKIMRRYKL